MESRSPYVLKKTGENQWTIGYYKPNYRWVAVSNWMDAIAAAEEVRVLNSIR